MVADLLRLVRQVVRIDADAVPADQARAERQEVPLAARRVEHFLGIDVQPVEDQRQLVDQRDVHVALRVLDDLGGLGHADAGGLVGAGGDDRAVQAIDEVGDLGRGARGDLADGREAVLLVAGIDALGAVAGKEVAVELQARHALEDRHADLFGAPRVHGRLVDHDRAAAQCRADGLARPYQRAQVRPLVLIDRRRHGDDEDLAALELLQIGGEGQPPGALQLGGGHLEGDVAALGQLRDAHGLHVEADGVVVLAELHGQRQADVAQADDGDAALPDLGDRVAA